MGVTVLGIQHKVGEFNGFHYDNYNLYCTEEVALRKESVDRNSAAKTAKAS